MPRFRHSLSARLLAALAVAGLVGWVPSAIGGCSAQVSSLEDGNDAAGPILQRDSTPVDIPDASKGSQDSGTSNPPPSCAKYCELVTKNCEGPQAQYGSEGDCLAFCKHLPLGDPGDDDVGTVACRQYFAGNAARTSPAAYCPQAGPFGGGVCGDRCTAFCDVALSACAAEAGAPTAYVNQGDCNTACADFAYKDKDAGPDSGGETPSGPTSGNTLNCRLFYLRKAVKLPQDHCADLKQQSPSCK